MPKLRKDIRILRGEKLSVSEWRSYLEKLMSKLVTSKGFCEAAMLGGCGGYLQLSHVYPKGSYRGLQFDIFNVQSLCFRHHMKWWHLNPMDAREWFATTFPERWSYLQEAKLIIRHFTDEDYRKIYEAIKAKDIKHLIVNSPLTK